MGVGRWTKSILRGSSREVKERRRRQAELQEQERLLKQQKLSEPGIPLAGFASEIESSSTPGSEQVQEVEEETLDLQLDEQESHPNEQET